MSKQTTLNLGLPGVRKWTGQSGNQTDRPGNYRTMWCLPAI